MPTNHFNGLTEAEQEALTLLFEECGEVVQIIGKIMRHGLDSEHPKSKMVNRDQLAKEVGDVLSAVEILVRDDVISNSAIASWQRAKARKMRRNPSLLHHIDPL